MEDNPLACPECGSSTFKQRRVALIEAKMEFDAQYGRQDASEEVIDGGDRDGEIVCDECGWIVEDDELVDAAEDGW